jgi:hypothetical protein
MHLQRLNSVLPPCHQDRWWRSRPILSNEPMNMHNNSGRFARSRSYQDHLHNICFFLCLHQITIPNLYIWSRTTDLVKDKRLVVHSRSTLLSQQNSSQTTYGVRSGDLQWSWRRRVQAMIRGAFTSIRVPASRRRPETSCSAWLPSQTPRRGMLAPTMAAGLLALPWGRRLDVDLTVSRTQTRHHSEFTSSDMVF